MAIMDSVTTAFELMALELSNAVEDLNAEGGRQFKSSHYEEAKRLIDKGVALRDFCNRVSALASEWSMKFAEQNSQIQDVVEVAETARRILSASKASKTGLVARFPDGTVVCEASAADTLAKTIQKIGFLRVEALGIEVNYENIVSLKKSPKYNDVHLPPYYVKTHSNTEQKKKHLERISDELQLNLRVSVLD